MGFCIQIVFGHERVGMFTMLRIVVVKETSNFISTLCIRIFIYIFIYFLFFISTFVLIFFFFLFRFLFIVDES